MMKSSNHMPSDLPHLLFICPLQESGTAFVQSFIVIVAKLLHFFTPITICCCANGIYSATHCK